MRSTLLSALVLGQAAHAAQIGPTRYTYHPSKAGERHADCDSSADYLAREAMYAELQRRQQRVIAAFSAEWDKIEARLTACTASADPAERIACATQADDFAARADAVRVTVPPGEVVVHTDCGRRKRAVEGLVFRPTIAELDRAIRLSLRLRAQTPPPAGIWEGPATGYRMAWIPPGTFQMGARPSTAEDSGHLPPRTHPVTLTQGFFIGITEVTQAEWNAATGRDPSSRYFDPRQPDQYPVDTISWWDALAFANAASVKDGLTPAYDLAGEPVLIPNANGYRLPTEAEWERAAQGAGEPTLYAGGPVLDAVAWSRGNAGGQPHAVCTRIPNALGLCDMSGNLREWTWDTLRWWEDGGVTDPVGQTAGINHTQRGGSWLDDAYTQEITTRHESNSRYARSFIGVRLVRSGP